VSVSFSHVEPPSEVSRLRARVARLRGSLEWAADAISPKIRERILASVDRCEDRLDLGIEWTIVALAGGTGSGKSSLFNALSGSQLAEVGVSRPTTAHASAATWGGKAEALLDWVGVEASRRVEGHSALNTGDARLSGLVLLDLPDHDSVSKANRDLVDRVVPRADLLLWVVDPQKYADNALHAHYLQTVADYGMPSAMVLNHVDRLARSDADAIMFDLHRLLEDKGIGAVPVLMTSARTGAGVDSLRGAIAVAVERRTVAAEAVRAELAAVGGMLAKALAKASDPVMPNFASFVDGLSRAAGVHARAEAAASVAGGTPGPVPTVSKLTAAAVHPVRDLWLDEATAGMPRSWRRVLARVIPHARTIASVVNEALEHSTWPVFDAVIAGRFSKPKPNLAVEQAFIEHGAAVITGAVGEEIVGPTETMHQSYRALDELSTLSLEDD